MGMINGLHGIICTLIFLKLLLTSKYSVVADSFPGHLQKLGSHTSPQGVTVIGKFSDPQIFFKYFVDPFKPIVMKGVLQQGGHPGLTEWTDEYLREKYGSEKVKVEPRKLEERNLEATWLSLSQFLTLYKQEGHDLYLVHSLNNAMQDLALIPKTLQCGGYQNMLQDAVLWLGSGNTSSVLHRDCLDNFLCLLDGEKEIVLIDKDHRQSVESHGFDQDGGYSHINPLSVDMEKFFNFRTLPWHTVQLSKGDCVYIPQHWYHQVNSHGSRHMSVNIWFAHLWWFNTSSCPRQKSLYKTLEPVSTFGFGSPNEIHRSNLLRRFKNRGFLTEDRFHELLPNNPTRKRSNEFFNSINAFSDVVLSWGELYSFDIDKILMSFHDVFDFYNGPYDIISRDKKLYLYDDEEDSDSEEEHEDGEIKQEGNVEKEESRLTSLEPNSDDLSPLPDALSVDEVLLPDDSIGRSSRHDIHEDKEQLFQRDEDKDKNEIDHNVREKPSNTLKDEL